ncbi:MAG TPA: hypothetical protein GXZ96_03230 [Firmicutes bacterium]|jgi:hypothetical protein|nr:hypothetical protein [Bacillota bacterium]
MSDAGIDKLVNEGWLPLHRRIMENLRSFSGFFFLQSVALGRQNRIGLRVMDAQDVVGEYTIVMDGLNPSDCLTGMENLGIEIFNFGSFPFTIEVQRGLLEEIVEKQDELFDDPVGGILKYLPGLAIRFG